MRLVTTTFERKRKDSPPTSSRPPSNKKTDFLAIAKAFSKRLLVGRFVAQFLHPNACSIRSLDIKEVVCIKGRASCFKARQLDSIRFQSESPLRHFICGPVLQEQSLARRSGPMAIFVYIAFVHSAGSKSCNKLNCGGELQCSVFCSSLHASQCFTRDGDKPVANGSTLKISRLVRPSLVGRNK